jgi:hypothetical protein
MMMAYGKDYEVSYIASINFRANLDAQNVEWIDIPDISGIPVFV